MALGTDFQVTEETRKNQRRAVETLTTLMLKGKADYEAKLLEFEQKSTSGPYGSKLESLRNCREFGKVALALNLFKNQSSYVKTLTAKPRADHLRLKGILENSASDDIFLINLFEFDPVLIFESELIRDPEEALLYFYVTDIELYEQYREKIAQKLIPISRRDFLFVVLYNHLFFKNDAFLSDALFPYYSGFCAATVHAGLEERIKDIIKLRESLGSFSFLRKFSKARRAMQSINQYFIPSKNQPVCTNPTEENMASILALAITAFGRFHDELINVKAPFTV